tara:strand:- start:42 stop:170 length:129 start_codon:yes stop_codon:yes gene_type:complete
MVSMVTMAEMPGSTVSLFGSWAYTTGHITVLNAIESVKSASA